MHTRHIEDTGVPRMFSSCLCPGQFATSPAVSTGLVLYLFQTTDHWPTHMYYHCGTQANNYKALCVYQHSLETSLSDVYLKKMMHAKCIDNFIVRICWVQSQSLLTLQTHFSTAQTESAFMWNGLEYISQPLTHRFLWTRGHKKV